MTHYFLENQTEDVRKRASEGKLSGPVFVGQGCTRRCGSDSYGYYVAEIVEPGRIAGVVHADEKFVSSWTDGSMECSFPADRIVRGDAAGRSPVEYVMRYGRKWYEAVRLPDGTFRRRPGRHAGLSWNGSYSYRDPSF